MEKNTVLKIALKTLKHLFYKSKNKVKSQKNSWYSTKTKLMKK